MKIYTFGDKTNPALMLLPGTWCHWRTFSGIIPLLERDFYLLCVSYDGFDETEKTEFPTMLEETSKIENSIKRLCGGRIRGAYGCSLGGSFVGLLIVRNNIHIDFGIIGSSDLDQSSPLAAKLSSDLLVPKIYPLVRDGRLKSESLQKKLDEKAAKSPDYVGAFLKIFSEPRPYVTLASCRNQYYSDLITPLPDKIDTPDSEIHVFYALKMGKKYRARYQKHFAHPIIHEFDLQHEELLIHYPQKWCEEVRNILLSK